MTLHLNEDQLIGYTHQTLTDAERETIDQHLAGCPPCRAVLDDHENLQRRIHNDLSTELRHNGPSPRMNYAAMAPRVKRQRRYYVFTKQSSQLLSNAVAIIVLVVAGFGLLYLFNSIGQPETAPLERVTTIAVEATEQPATVPATEVSQPSVGATAEVNQPPAGPVEFVMEITGDPNPFSNPVDVAVDQAGNLYVVDGFNHRIQKFDPNGQFLTMWGSQGDGDGQFKFAIRIDAADAAVAVDEQGQVYVADLGNARIQKFDSGGQFLATWGSYGLDNGQFLHPTGVAVDQQGNVYVLDIGRDDVQKFDGEGRFLAKWGSRGMEAGQLSGAFYLAVDMAGNVYVPDTDTNRVSKFDPNGQLLTMWGEKGSADGQFHGPYGIATDGQGHIFVVDQFNNRIQMFDQQGQFLGQWGTLGNGPGQFKEPAGLTVDKEGYIYVADYGNNRIQKFRLLEIGASVNGN